VRNCESYGAEIANNQLTNISDADRCANPKGEKRPGPEQPLTFECGAGGEFAVDGWQAARTKSVTTACHPWPNSSGTVPTLPQGSLTGYQTLVTPSDTGPWPIREV
jgi:hypothetical protein